MSQTPLDVVASAVEAARLDSMQRSSHEMEIRRLQEEREQMMKNFAERVKGIEAAHAVALEELRVQVKSAAAAEAEAKQKAVSVECQLNDARTAISRIQDDANAKVTSLTAASNEAVKTFQTQQYGLSEKLKQTEREKLQAEWKQTYNTLRGHETASRYDLAIRATGERAWLVNSKLKSSRDEAVGQFEKQLTTVKDTVAAVEVKRDDAVAGKSAAEERCRRLENELREVGGKLEVTVAEAAYAQRRNDEQTQALRSEIRGLQNEVQTATASREQERTAASQSADVLNQQTQALRQELHDGMVKQQQFEASIPARIEAAVNDERQRTQDVAAQLRETTSLVQTLQDKIRDLEVAAAQKSAERSKAEATVAVAVAESRGFADEVRVLKEQAAASDAKAKAATAKLQEELQIRGSLEASLKTLQDDNRRLHANKEKLESRTTSAEAAANASRKEATEASQRCRTLEAASADVADRAGSLEALDSELEDRKTLQHQVSVLTQENKEIRKQAQQLRDHLTLTEARYLSTETKLQHNVKDGVATSALLEKGLSRIRTTASVEADTAETKAILSQAAYTLRRALEEQGFDMATLPLAPTSNLDMPYLQQVLLDHSTLCAQQLQRTGGRMGATAIPSAMKTPVVYRKMADY